MRKVLKWIGIVLAGIVVLLMVVLVTLIMIGGAKLNKSFEPEVIQVAMTNDPVAIARGKHLVEAITPCADCHGDNLGGETMINDPIMAVVSSANLTSGKGGAASEFSDEDWVRALRYGVSPEGKGLIIMPAIVTTNYSDEDLAAVVAYLRSVQPVDNELPENKFGPLGRILAATGQLPPFSAELISTRTTWPQSVPPEITASYGQYLVDIGGCRDCHGPNLAGNPSGGGENEAPAGPNLTPGGELVGWSESDFINAIQTGLKPSGTTMSDEMPWKSYGKMTADELKAIWLYLSSLEALPANQPE